MNSDEYAELVSQLTAGRLAVSDTAHCASLLAQLNGLRSWVESGTIAVTRRLNELAIETRGSFPNRSSPTPPVSRWHRPFNRSDAPKPSS